MTMATADPDGLLREEAASLSAWVELIRHRFTALTITPHDPHGVDGAISSRRIGPLQASSVRTLHRLFARQELTVSAWIKSRRLEACRRALCSPGAADTRIREIAARHGFPHAPLFSREFAQRYGETPRECRRRHEGHDLSP